MEQLEQSIREHRLSDTEVTFYSEELAAYLAREVERFGHYGQMFSDPQVQDGFADVVAALRRLHELAQELGPATADWSEAERREFLEDARDADRLLSDTAEFLQG